MNIYNTFVRFFDTDDQGEEILGTDEFVSLSDLASNGPPIDDNEETKDFDQSIYFQTEEGEFILKS